MEAVNGDNILDIENGENKILSFDYHMQLLVCKRNDRENTENDKKADNEESDRDEWETLINASAYDFPNVRRLKADIRTILDSNMEDAQIVRDNSGEPYEKSVVSWDGGDICGGWICSSKDKKIYGARQAGYV